MGEDARILQVGALLLDVPLIDGQSTTFQEAQRAWQGTDSGQSFTSGWSRSRILLSDQCQSILADARYEAASKVFAAAISAQVDLVLITGKLCEYGDDSRAYWFLKRECQRLDQCGIAVVCLETTDHFAWPSSIELPTNLRILTRTQSIGFRLGESRSSVELDWASVDPEFRFEPTSDLYLQLHEFNGEVTEVTYSLTATGIDSVVPVQPLYGDSTHPDAPGEATLVSVDMNGNLNAVKLSTATLSWETLNVQIIQGESQAELQSRLINEFKRFEEARGANPVKSLLSIWLTSSTGYAPSFSPAELETFLQSIQQAAGRQASSGVWPYRISLQTAFPQDFAGTQEWEVAQRELSQLALEDVYENLDVHVLEIDSARFGLLQTSVALRLAEILSAGEPHETRLLNLS